jgi:type 1 fimbria pilin
MRRGAPWRIAGAAALGAAMVPVLVSPAAAGEQEVTRSVTFTFGGAEVTCAARHWDFLRTSGSQTTLQVGTELLDGNPGACFDAVRHAEVTMTYRRADGSDGYATAASPGAGEVTAGVVEQGALSDILVRHSISFACDGERCNAGDYVITAPK